eukprot:5875510-Prymnesium_polylepis.1
MRGRPGVPARAPSAHGVCYGPTGRGTCVTGRRDEARVCVLTGYEDEGRGDSVAKKITSSSEASGWRAARGECH